jgi:hypothetical protein
MVRGAWSKNDGIADVRDQAQPKHRAAELIDLRQRRE